MFSIFQLAFSLREPKHWNVKIFFAPAADAGYLSQVSKRTGCRVHGSHLTCACCARDEFSSGEGHFEDVENGEM